MKISKRPTALRPKTHHLAKSWRYMQRLHTKKATAKRRPHGQIAARWGELRFGLRSESWAYRLGFIRTDWSGWAGLRGAHKLPCGSWSKVRDDEMLKIVWL